MKMSANTVEVSRIPASETGHGVLCTTRSGAVYRITQNPQNNRHTLWRTVSGGFVKMASAASPDELYELIDWRS